MVYKLTILENRKFHVQYGVVSFLTLSTYSMNKKFSLNFSNLHFPLIFGLVCYNTQSDRKSASCTKKSDGEINKVASIDTNTSDQIFSVNWLMTSTGWPSLQLKFLQSNRFAYLQT